MDIKDCYLTMDIGGTKTRLALLDPSGGIIAGKTFPTPGNGNPQTVLQRIGLVSKALLQGRDSLRLRGVGAALAGFISDRRRVNACPNLAGWEDYPLGARLEERFHVPALVENDANAAAVGENIFGAGKGAEDMIFLTISTGIGAGIISGGRLLRGAGGLAGEVGHLKLAPEGNKCGCGQEGCLEADASGTALAAKGEKYGAKDAAGVFAAAGEGAEWAVEVLEDSLMKLGIHIANMVSLLNPSLVVIGGGMAAQGERLFQPLRYWVSKLAAPGSAEDTALIPALLGDNAGLLGMGAILSGEWG